MPADDPISVSEDHRITRLAPPAPSMPDVLTAYAQAMRRRVLVVALLSVGCLLTFGLDLLIGPSELAPRLALQGLFEPETLSRPQAIIIWEVRLPTALMALLVGAALSLAGAEMQTILNNPLASPFTLGISEAASLGAALAIMLGIAIPGLASTWLVPINAFLFAFGAVLLLQMLARVHDASAHTLILFGIALVFLFDALVALIQFVASAEALQQFVFWTLGNLSRGGWDGVRVLSPLLACIVPFSLAGAWQMTALRLGEDRARSFGVNIRRVRFMSLVRVSLLASGAVAFVGTIAFVGLVGPHIARMLIGEDHRFFLPASLLTGALVLSLASITSKLIIPGVLIPVGLVTSLIGVPVFLILVLRKRRAL